MAQLDNNIMNMSMTRSIYVGTDKTAEVLKRKEAAEKDRMARCEAKMREQEERLARAKNNKENELRERIRERQQKELERQKAALDRRCAQLNKLTAKKEEILQKNHQKASRILTNRPQKKLAFVFGSSTPRELCYLEKGGQQKRSNQTLSINSRGSTPPKLNLRSEPVSSRVPSRFMTNNRVEKPVHPSDVMTRSVLGSLGSSAPTNKQQPTSPRRKPSAVKKQQSKSPIIPSTANKNNGPVSSSLMTQSLYSARPVQNGFSKSNGHSSEKKNENVSNEKTNMDLRQQRRPVIRPKVENQLMKSCNIETTISTNVQQTELDFSLLREKTFEETETFIKDKVVLTDTNDSESLLNADINNIGSSNFVSPLLEEVRPPNIHVSHVELSNTTFLISDDNKLTSLQTQMEECSSIEDRNRESILSDRTLVLSRAGRDSTNTIVDATDTTLILISEQDQRSPSSNHSSLEESEVLTPKIDRTIPPMAIPPILEEKRNQRRQKLDEILQRTRTENVASPQMNSSSNGFTKKDNTFSDTPTTPTAISIENPLMSKSVDRSAALAAFLKHRRMMNKQESNGIEQQQQLPGQVSATIVPNNPSVNTIFHSEEKFNGSEEEDYNYRTVRTPPEDPHMNNNGNNEEIAYTY